MHSSPPAVAPASAGLQPRQIALAAAAAVAAFALAFGIGKATSSGEEATAAPERPQAIQLPAVSIASPRSSSGALAGLKDEPRTHHAAAQPKSGGSAGPSATPTPQAPTPQPTAPPSVGNNSTSSSSASSNSRPSGSTSSSSGGNSSSTVSSGGSEG